MKKDRISVAFVGLYEQQLPLIPQLDTDFCKQLFGQPDVTTVGIIQEGLIISTNNKPFPLVIIGLQKVAIKVANEKMLTQCIKSLQAELESKGIKCKFSAFGINYEYQYIDIKQPAAEWMWNRFLQKSIHTEAKFQSCPRLSLKFDVNDVETINLTLEPRVGVRDGIFVDVNHHHGIVLAEMNDQLIRQYYAESHKLVENYLDEIVVNNHE